MTDAGATGAGVTVRTPAKVNLHLGVGHVRPDGFHPLDTVFHAISLYDDVTVSSGDPGSGPRVRVLGEAHVGLDEVPVDGDNLAHRAARLLGRSEGLAPDVLVEIHKSIPVAGGLAGGSADAAATLVALDRLWGTEVADVDLYRLAAELGSDVSFALLGGSARGTGRGEVLQRLTDHGSWWWVVVIAAEGLSTPAVYRRFDELFTTAPAKPSPGADVERALANGDPAALARALRNDLEPAALDLRPELDGLIHRGEAAGALRGLVSGSGPTCVFLCADAATARAVAGELQATEGPRGAHVLVATGPAAGAHRVTYDRPVEAP
ncbi:4-(cytidine 5'-diphospho)-2-C-methyl-D-erythritol kinase [Nocardioides lentus]|uniref:4-diphosphocytidyl-2-C-methyl-D-erythritol kinase n=1 Tax=Nocardioides lentus TaxID=338077 RepID=A0ABN2PGB9_9ACTN